MILHSPAGVADEDDEEEEGEDDGGGGVLVSDARTRVRGCVEIVLSP